MRLLLPFLMASALVAQAPVWHTDLAKAKAIAAKEQKPLLVNFTGSTWCPYCVLLEKEVLASATFATWSKQVVLLKLDYPGRAERTEDKVKANAALAQLMTLKDQYKIQGFPTVMLMRADGTELHRTAGYQKGMGPEAWVAQYKVGKP